MYELSILSICRELLLCVCFFFQAEDGIRDLVRSRGLGDVYKRQVNLTFPQYSPLRIQYKYGANWGLASNGGGNDNENGVGADHFINLTSDLLSATVENVFGTMGDHQLVNIVTDVKELQSGTPVAYELSQNYPNPFNPSTQIRFAIPEAGIVNIKVFNTLGQEITTLVSDYRNAGSYEVDFNASNLTSGIYFYTITSNNFSETRKMMLLK